MKPVNLAALLLCLLLPLQVWAQIAPQRFQIETLPSHPQLPYAATSPLSEGSKTAVRAILALHGGDPIAEAYVQRTLGAVDLAGVSRDSIYIIAPQFLQSENVAANDVDGDLVYWSAAPFYGSKSAETRGTGAVRLSSYHVLDLIIKELCDRTLFPKLNSIVVAGHSAGGQMVNRFVAISPAEELFAEPNHIRMRYIVMNPSSYMYFDDTRWVEGPEAGFVRPNASHCPDFNAYPYGMENLYAHHLFLGGADVMPGRYEKRSVYYFVGDLDNVTEGGGLSVTCAAELQGASRLERGRIYYRHLLTRFGPSIAEHQFFAIVPGAGHSSLQMLQSGPVRSAIFAGLVKP